MLNALLAFSVRQRLFVVLGALGLLTAGLASLLHLPVDAVPDLTGLSVAQAQSVLERQGLVLGSQTPEVSGKPVDTIIGQQPTPGEQLEEGQAVNVTISAGKEKTTVPPLSRTTTLRLRAWARRSGNCISSW